jgi:putative membrane-bound dehydrogenase-like protein
MTRAPLLLVGLCLCHPALVRAQLTPQEALTKFTVADGLQIELFAAEPMLINPTSIDVDHCGRVWVCEAVNYRISRSGKPLLRLEGDRIVILEDTDGDGKADKAHVFYQAKDFVAPLGIAVAPYPDGKGQKVFVCHHSDILVFEDKDGDLKADGPPTKLLSGFGGFDTDHGLHGINIGPDGKLYFTVGDAGVKGVQSSDGKGPKWTSNQTECRAGTIWRCDMDGKNLELIAHNFRNHYECCVNSFGEIWTSDNDDDGTQQTRLCYVMPGGNYGYHPRGPGQSHWHEEQPGIVHKVLRTGFGSPSGICFYEGSLLPQKYHGQILHCDAGPREFRCFHITPKGAGYEAEKEVLVTSSDNWFRLSDCCVAPDGSVMLADWYDPGVGGNGMGDWTRGRIYRVTPKGHKGYKVPSLHTQEDVLGALGSPCAAARTMAKKHLKLMKVADAFNGIRSALRKDAEATLKARAYWCLFDQLTPAKLKDYLAAVEQIPDRDRLEGSNDPRLRTFMRRCAADLFPIVREFEPGPHPFPGEVDAHQHIEIAREVLLGLRNYSGKEVNDWIIRCANYYDGQDHFYLAALNIACGTDPPRRDAILADFDKHFPEWNDKVADLVWELRPKSMMSRLPRLLNDPKLTGPQKARIVDILAASDELSAGQSLLALLGKDSPAEVRERALENLRLFLPTKWKDLIASRELQQAVESLLAEFTTKTMALRLIAAAGLSAAVDTVADIAVNEKEVTTAIEAIRTLGKLPTPAAVAALQRIASTNSALALEAVNALGDHLPLIAKRDKATSELALKALQGVLLRQSASPELRRATLSALAGSYDGTKWLIAAHELKLLPADLIADAGKLLRNSPYQAQRNQALALFPTPGKVDLKKLPPIAELAKRIGDVERGNALFAASLRGETQCLRCHTVRGRGGNIGPDLSMIGKKASKENLFESILLPSKAIADQYLQWKIETSAGQALLGLIVEETPAAIVLRDANGKDTKIPLADIESRSKSPTSIMPDNLVGALSEDDLVDLVGYLFTLKTPSLTPESWYIAGPFDAIGKGLDAAYEPEQGGAIDLAATYKGKNGAVRWQTVRNQGGYVDLAHDDPAKTKPALSYLYQRIESPVDQQAALLIGYGDGAKIWLNGALVHTGQERAAAVPERRQVAIKLNKGVNTLLLKLSNGEGPFGVYCSIASEQELKVATAIK